MTNTKSLRIVIFADNSGFVPYHLMHAVSRSLHYYQGKGAGNVDAKIVAICTHKSTRKQVYRFAWMNWLSDRLQYTNATQRFADKHNIPFFELAKGQVNDKRFLFHLHKSVQPTTVLSLFFIDVFSDDFIRSFSYLVNYHNSLLPQYKGLKATRWAVFNGEKELGFTFHKIEKGLDQGNILMSQSLSIESVKSIKNIDKVLAKKAAKRVPELVAMINTQEQGQPQQGEGSYYSFDQYKALQFTQQPEQMSADELIRLILAFGPLNLKINHQFRGIRKIQVVNKKRSMKGVYYFYSKDGELMEARTFTNRHYWFFAIQEWLKKPFLVS